MLKRYRVRDYNFKLVIFLIAISTIGVLIVGSAKAEVQSKQLLGLIAGVFFMVVISLFDYSFFLQFYWVIYFVNLILLILVRFAGVEVNNAKRWLEIAGIQFQPSETAKILLILFFSQYIMKHKETLNTFKTLASCVGLLIPQLWLIYNQPDLSTSIMIVILICAIIFIGGLSYRIIGITLAIVVPLVVVFLLLVVQPDQKLINPYQQKRILAWLHPQEYSNSEGYQQDNSITAIGSGQLFGKGYNNNVISSVKNGNFISEPQTDFIFAIVGEELGFVGGSIVIILLLLISLECILIAKKSKDLAGTLICTGMATLVGCQGFINISVATGAYAQYRYTITIC